MFEVNEVNRQSLLRTVFPLISKARNIYVATAMIWVGLFIWTLPQMLPHLLEGAEPKMRLLTLLVLLLWLTILVIILIALSVRVRRSE